MILIILWSLIRILIQTRSVSKEWIKISHVLNLFLLPILIYYFHMYMWILPSIIILLTYFKPDWIYKSFSGNKTGKILLNLINRIAQIFYKISFKIKDKNSNNDIMSSSNTPIDAKDINLDDVDDLNDVNNEVSQPIATPPVEKTPREKAREKRRAMESARKGGRSSGSGSGQQNMNAKIAQLTGKKVPGNIPPQYASLLDSLMGNKDMDELMKQIPSELLDSNGKLRTDTAALAKAFSHASSSKKK